MTFVGLIFLVLALPDCNTPIIPLPPPSVDSMSMAVVDATTNQVTISGKSINLIGATIHVINLADGFGTIAKADAEGAFTTHTFTAKDQDEVSVDYRSGGEVSDPVCVVIDYQNGLSSCPE
jgi:hypothetical protein